MSGIVPQWHRLCRTFSWFGRNRRLAEDFENLGEAWPLSSPLASIRPALGELLGVGRGCDKLTGCMHDDGGLQADSEETFAGTRGNDKDAPEADLSSLADALPELAAAGVRQIAQRQLSGPAKASQTTAFAHYLQSSRANTPGRL